jgi:hypothetical protein
MQTLTKAYMADKLSKQHDHLQAREIEENIAAGYCPPFRYRVERGCMRMAKGKCRYLINPDVGVCEACWKRAFSRADIRERLTHGERNERARRGLNLKSGRKG